MIYGHEQYMREALRQATIAFEKDEVPIGCVIVSQGRIIARAHNQIKTLTDPTAHAEMIAITQAAAHFKNERLTDCDIYATIEPCPMCAGAMVLARIRHLYFAAYDAKAGAAGSVMNILKNDRLNHRVPYTQGLMEEDARGLMREFFKGKRMTVR